MLEFGEREKEHLRETCGDRGCVQHAIEVIAERDAEIERLKAKNNILKEASARGGLDQMQGMISALEIRLADANKSAEIADAKVERLERELAAGRERFERLKRCLYRYNAKYLFDQFESGEREAKNKAKGETETKARDESISGLDQF
jgi:predicted  nucleic acid-binding Zn-ribbon protein